jgi:hypothetical protein
MLFKPSLGVDPAVGTKGGELILLLPPGPAGVPISIRMASKEVKESPIVGTFGPIAVVDPDDEKATPGETGG